MNRTRLMIVLALATSSVGGVLVAACGGSDATLCGPGTTLVGGICQVVSTDATAPDAPVGPDGDSPDGTIELDATPGPDGTSADASDASVAPNRCPFGKGPVMAEIPNPGNVGTFCIDSTEVTEAQYDKFLKDKNGNTGGQILECAWNTIYAPSCPPDYTFDPVQNPNKPVRCVDWCDARAFCEWSGKKLCGQLDKSDGPAVATSRAHWACTNGNATTHPQGTLSDNTCWLKGATDAAAVNVASVGCKGKFAPYDGVHDVLGNVIEWQSYCKPDSGIIPGVYECNVYGGSYLNGNDALGCGAPANAFTLQRSFRGVPLGIRCCAD